MRLLPFFFLGRLGTTVGAVSVTTAYGKSYGRTQSWAVNLPLRRPARTTIFKIETTGYVGHKAHRHPKSVCKSEAGRIVGHPLRLYTIWLGLMSQSAAQEAIHVRLEHPTWTRVLLGISTVVVAIVSHPASH